MAGFSPSEIIDDPNLLFGRNKSGQLLEKLIINVIRGTNCQVQGEKRSGKTSTLICLKKKLESEYSEKVIPIYINWKEHAWVKGTSNVYRFILANCIQYISKAKILSETIELNSVTLKPSLVWENAYEELLKLEDFRLQGLIKEFVIFFSDLCGRGFVFLFDEYEHLFVYNLDRTEGFFSIRTLSEEPFRNNYKPLTYLIAGAKSWDKLGSQTGSPELNSMGAGILYLSPLGSDDFKEMWDYSLKKANAENNILLKNAHTIFDKSGGVPFYAKVIGESVVNQNEVIDYNLLLPHFEEIYKSLDGQELHVIKSILNKKYDAGNLVFRLLEKRGIIIEVNKKYQINGSLLGGFINAKISSKDISLDERQVKLLEKAKRITALITSINKTQANKKLDLVFKLTNEDAVMIDDLETICLDAEDMTRFSSAMYKILFERTKNSKPLDLLPTNFQRSNLFVRIVDALRHHFGGHLTSDRTQKYSDSFPNVGKLLEELIESKNDPKDGDFYKIQDAILTRFIQFLGALESTFRGAR